MNLYDKANLIITPNAYKASKIYAAKPNDGSGDLTFSRASAKYRRNASGVLEALVNNVPALEYPIGGGCPGWLYEPQRTNIILRSQGLNTSPWTLADISVVENSITAPDGTFTGNKITLNSGAVNTLERANQSMTIAAGLTYTFSVWVKAGDYTGSMQLRGDATTNTASIVYNFTTGVVTSTGSNVVSATKVVDSDGWVRLILVFTTVLNPQVDVLVFNGQQATKFYYCWGVQLEAGAFATSYIPTTSSTVTRVFDDSSVALGSLLSNKEGTLCWDLTITTPTNKGLVYLGALVGGANYVRYRINSITPQNEWNVSSSFINQHAGGSIVLGRNKIVFSFIEGNVTSLYINGAKIGDSSLGTIFVPSTLQLGNYSSIAALSNPLNLFCLFNQKLTDAECIALAT